MADFFEKQAEARRNSGRLVFLFVLAVLAIVGLLNLLAYLFIPLEELESLSRTGLHIGISVVTIGFIALGSIYKFLLVSRQGGISIALELGGQPVDPNTTDPNERRLLNIVEEMAIASGVPVPEVFVLNEDGINAFAAGESTKDAVIAVTRGCIETLNRDELQGVVAHEYSHIFHGDMRLNMHIFGVLFGIMMISSLGRILIFGISPFRYRRRRGGNLQLLILGVCLLVIGSIGVLFGKLIQAAVSRQREYLADASAVQYTRNPSGIAGALKKIGGWTQRSEIQNPKASDMSHFFISSPFQRQFSSFLASHPPLAKRIKAIDPSFNGKFEPVKRFREHQMDEPGVASIGGTAESLKPSESEVLENIGLLKQEHIESTRSLIQGLPGFLVRATREPYSARAVVYSLFLHEEDDLREKQKAVLVEKREAVLWPSVERSFTEIQKKGSSIRLPLLELALPSLKKLSEAQKKSFLETSQRLIQVDERLHMFEYSIIKLLIQSLVPPKKKEKRKLSKQSMLEASTTVLSALAQSGQANPAQAQQAFSESMKLLGVESAKLLPLKDCRPKLLDEAINRLSFLSFPDRRELIKAAVHAVQHDAVLDPLELELLRATAQTLEIPIASGVAA